MAGGLRFGFDPRYAEAVFHCPEHRVLGKRLRPFSAWHKLQLEFHNSPLVGGGDVKVEDLELAVRVCQTQWPHQATMKPKKGLWLTLWLFWAERVELKKEVELFERYKRDFFSPPKLWPTPTPKGSTPRRRDIDDSIESVCAYLAIYGGPRGDAWNMPIGELEWMTVCGDRRAGANIMIWTPSDEREFQAHKKQREAKIQQIAVAYQAQDPELSPEDARKKAEKYYWKTVRKNLMSQGFAPEVADIGR